MSSRAFLTLYLVVAGFFFSVGKAAAEDCGEISIGSTNWASAEIIAQIDKLILSGGYGCTVALSKGETMANFAAMNEFGKPDLIPEVWVNSLREQLDAAVRGGRLIIGAQVLSDGGEQGWWIPRYLADENPDIKTVADALARPELFASIDEPETGAVYNCPPDWPCRIAMDNLFRALKAEDKGFSLISTNSAAELDASIARAYENRSGWLGYYWSPTSMLGRYDLVKLEMGSHDPEQWSECTAVPDCTEPGVNAWPSSKVLSIFTEAFAEKASVAVDYVSTRQWSNKTVNELLVWMDDNQATGEEVAYHFLENYQSIWTAWVPAEIVIKVKDRL